MPINAFGGGPGSGKTYGVVEHVILPAIARGRFVLTNIEGLEEEAIYEYVVKNAPAGKIICIGHIRRCSRSAPDEEGFFPGEDALDKPCPVPRPDSPTVAGGDLVVIDEATRYWPQGEKIKKSHAYFFREHRHFANEMGHTCDLVVIDPDLTLLARPLKGKIELSSVTHKPKEIGLNRYVVRLFRGVRLTGKPVSVQGPYAFRKEIYSLYKSYAHAGAKEQAIDKRQNLLLSKRIWIGVTILLLVAGSSIGGLIYAWGKLRSNAEGASLAHATGAPATGSPASQAKPTGGAAGASPSSGNGQRVSSSLRVAGEVVIRGERWVTVVGEDGAVRLENPAAFVGRGVFVVGNIEGQRVAVWTGPLGSTPAGERK